MFLLLLFTPGCIIDNRNNNQSSQDNENNVCEQRWLCIDDYNIGYRNENCVFTNLTYCRKGCYYDRCIDLPDLSVIEIKAPTNISQGQKVKFFAVIQNTGSAPIFAELHCEVSNRKTSFDTKWYVDGSQVAYWCHNDIMPNQINTNYMSWVAQKGVHNISVVVDGSDFIEEVDEGNNQKSMLVEVD